MIDSLFPVELRRTLLSLRRDLHRWPELSGAEGRTAGRLHGELASLDPVELRRVAGTGLVARIRGRDPKASVIVLRGDIDALPIQEATGLDFSSETHGVMHACGHDIHATWAVGAAHLLTARPADSDVLIVLQPAEETLEGAARVLESGALRNAAAIFGAHVDTRYPVGRVVAQPGPLAASADTFRIEIIGRGAHGARPHEAADPVVGAGALIGALQTAISRRLDPRVPGVLTIGTVQGGSAPNVIPDRATLTGTLRATDTDTRRLLREGLQRVSEGVAKAHGLRAEIQIETGAPPLINDERAAGWARQAAVSLLGDEAVQRLGTANMGAEDFAYYLERMPGCFLRIGAREPGGEPTPAHTPGFRPAEESIFVGAAVLAEAARVAAGEVGDGQGN